MHPYVQNPGWPAEFDVHLHTMYTALCRPSYNSQSTWFRVPSLKPSNFPVASFLLWLHPVFVCLSVSTLSLAVRS